jgi:4a-hydroxytetrahydrobiopterin dehydratase
MDSSHLTKGHCVPCEGGTEPMESSDVAKYLTLLKTPWMVTDEGKKIEKKFKFKDFSESMQFVNKVADIAQEQGHHPDIEISYDKVKIELTTHAIGGLSTNDFIMASKIEPLVL